MCCSKKDTSNSKNRMNEQQKKIINNVLYEGENNWNTRFK